MGNNKFIYTVASIIMAFFAGTLFILDTMSHISSNISTFFIGCAILFSVWALDEKHDCKCG